jgi:lipoate---protein ligase
MKYLEATFPDDARNLACDEALLESCEEGEAHGVLRVWEPPNYFVVIGYANRVGAEVDVAACERLRIPILRRFSGGGAVLQGPGCVNYALVISNEWAGSIRAAYDFVLERHQRCISNLLGLEVEISGGSDLTVAGRKFSGNSQHRKRRFTIVHGTFLLNIDVSLIRETLPLPSKEPDYRRKRNHVDFLMNLGISPDSLQRSLREAWGAGERLGYSLDSRIARLARDRYSRDEWNFKF